jgi:demethylspheroidene O-methyltransferase
VGSVGLAARTTLFEGSFFADPLPTGADLATLIRVLHDHDDDAVLTLLRRVREALPPGGVLLVAEPMSGTSGAHASGDAYFGFYLAAMGSGRPRTVEELSDLLSRAGFRRIRPLRTHTPLLVRLIAASI